MLSTHTVVPLFLKVTDTPTFWPGVMNDGGGVCVMNWALLLVGGSCNNGHVGPGYGWPPKQHPFPDGHMVGEAVWSQQTPSYMGVLQIEDGLAFTVGPIVSRARKKAAARMPVRAFRSMSDQGVQS